ncbi:MAG: hypothetical protein ACLVL7_07085, partial [Anaerotruncus massiliensis (ex Togo et al. 2019)]
SKHFITIAAIILLSITILGAVLLAFASQYFKQDRYRLLEHNAQQAAELTYADFRSNLYQGVTPAVVLPRYTILADAIEADIYLANTDGKLLLFVSGSHSDYNEVDIPKNIISEACAAGRIPGGRQGRGFTPRTTIRWASPSRPRAASRRRSSSRPPLRAR